ncbi:unnamed protein product [Caenorhabditis brenneri]
MFRSSSSYDDHSYASGVITTQTKDSFCMEVNAPKRVSCGSSTSDCDVTMDKTQSNEEKTCYSTRITSTSEVTISPLKIGYEPRINTKIGEYDVLGYGSHYWIIVHFWIPSLERPSTFITMLSNNSSTSIYLFLRDSNNTNAMKEPIAQEEAPVSPYGLELIEDDDFEEIDKPTEDNAGSSDPEEVEEVEQNRSSSLEKLFDRLFEKIYTTAELLLMKSILTSCLSKYDKNEMREIDQVLLNGLQNSETLVTVAEFFLIFGNYRLSCEIIFCAAILSVQEFIANQQLKIELITHNAYARFADALPDPIGILFTGFELNHESFYTNYHGEVRVKQGISDLKNFLESMRNISMTDEWKLNMKRMERGFNGDE